MIPSICFVTPNVSFSNKSHLLSTAEEAGGGVDTLTRGVMKEVEGDNPVMEGVSVPNAERPEGLLSGALTAAEGSMIEARPNSEVGVRQSVAAVVVVLEVAVERCRKTDGNSCSDGDLAMSIGEE